MGKDFEKLEIKNVKNLNDKSYSRIVDRILNNKITHEFIVENGLTYDDIVDNFLPLLICVENNDVCKNCKGLESCKLEGVKGYYNVPLIDYYGVISTKFQACNYLNERNLYLYRDFEDELLNLKLKEEDIKIQGRVKTIKYLGLIRNEKNSKGLFLHGESGIGKTYLAICLANSLVLNKKEVAYVNVKKFVSEMNNLIFKDKGLFEEKLEIVKKAPYLFLDGLGNEKVSKFTRDDILFNILDYRKDNNLKNTIIISKYNQKELRKIYEVDNKYQANSFVDLIVNLYEDIEMIGFNNFR